MGKKKRDDSAESIQANVAPVNDGSEGNAKKKAKLEKRKQVGLCFLQPAQPQRQL